MIFVNLLASMLISMGVATTATPFNLETKPKEVNRDNNTTVTSFTYQPPMTSVQRNSTSYQYPVINGETNYQYSNRMQFSGYNEAVNVLATLTTESTTLSDSKSLRLGKTGPTQWTQQTVYTANDNVKTNNLIAMQITPYRYLTDANANIQMSLTTTFDIEISTQDPNYEWVYYEGPIYVQYDIFTSLDNDWQQYVDTATWNTALYNNNVIADLTSSENGYTYNKETITKTINITANGNNQWTTFTQQINIELVGDRNNYVYILMTPYLNLDALQEDIYTNKIEIISTSTGWALVAESSNGHTITLNGHMITPVSDYEVVDIPGLCFEILTMPFSFISQAFNLTLFPGTPYQVNISSIFLAIIGVLIFILVLRMIISKGGGV